MSCRLRGGTECRASILTLTFGTTRAAELSALRARRNSPHGNSLVLLNSDRRISLRENFHGLHPDSKPGATVLWRNEWTNCAKARTVPKSIKVYSVWQEVSKYFSCAERYQAGLSDRVANYTVCARRYKTVVYCAKMSSCMCVGWY